MEIFNFSLRSYLVPFLFWVYSKLICHFYTQTLTDGWMKITTLTIILESIQKYITKIRERDDNYLMNTFCEIFMR